MHISKIKTNSKMVALNSNYSYHVKYSLCCKNTYGHGNIKYKMRKAYHPKNN